MQKRGNGRTFCISQRMGCKVMKVQKPASEISLDADLGEIWSKDVKLPDDGLVNRRQDSERFFHIKEGVGREKGREVQGRGWGWGREGWRWGELGWGELLLKRRRVGCLLRLESFLTLWQIQENAFYIAALPSCCPRRHFNKMSKYCNSGNI